MDNAVHCSLKLLFIKVDPISHKTHIISQSVARGYALVLICNAGKQFFLMFFFSREVGG